ncbi:Methyltransferase-like protein 23 [Nymphon striatum]|nr:Methyltransferase-like protein 23 [Nymphon striatum]
MGYYGSIIGVDLTPVSRVDSTRIHFTLLGGVESTPAIMNADFGLYTWPAAVVLAQYIWYNSSKVRGKSVIEIGCGTALPGILASKCGAHVTLTDSEFLQHCLENCKRSCQINAIDVDVDIEIKGLTWGTFTPDLAKFLGNVEIILGSDCFYEPKEFEEVIATVAYLIKNNPQAEFWCSYQLRSTDWSIEQLLKKWNLCAEIVPLSSFEADSENIANSNLPGNHTIQFFIIKNSHHENLKKRAYNARVIEVEKGTFTPLVFSTTGGMGREAQKLLKILAERTELKTGQSYSDAMGFMRKRLRFELLKTTIIALRGYRGKRTDGIMDIGDLDLNLEPII